jgi:hypothetical protein
MSRHQEVYDAALHTLQTAKLTFPYNEGLPTSASQRTQVLEIALAICRQLRQPKITASFWKSVMMTFQVQMPETAVEENYFSPSRENEVWFPGKLCRMRREAKSSFPEKPAYYSFRLRVLGTN